MPVDQEDSPVLHPLALLHLMFLSESEAGMESGGCSEGRTFRPQTRGAHRSGSCSRSSLRWRLVLPLVLQLRPGGSGRGGWPKSAPLPIAAQTSLGTQTTLFLPENLVLYCLSSWSSRPSGRGRLNVSYKDVAPGRVYEHL